MISWQPALSILRRSTSTYILKYRKNLYNYDNFYAVKTIYNVYYQWTRSDIWKQYIINYCFLEINVSNYIWAKIHFHAIFREDYWLNWKKSSHRQPVVFSNPCYRETNNSESWIRVICCMASGFYHDIRIGQWHPKVNGHPGHRTTVKVRNGGKCSKNFRCFDWNLSWTQFYQKYQKEMTFMSWNEIQIKLNEIIAIVDECFRTKMVVLIVYIMSLFQTTIPPIRTWIFTACKLPSVTLSTDWT